MDSESWTVAGLAREVAGGVRLGDLLEGRPVLVVRHGTEVDSAAIYTPSEVSPRAKEALLAGADAAETQVAVAASPLGEIAFGPNRVASLAKSTRNPFAGMITIGRARNNDVCLAATGVSKIHCFLYEQGGEWVIEDNGSTNGTCLDGVELAPKVKTALPVGSLLDFGGVHAVFLDEEGLAMILEMQRRSG